MKIALVGAAGSGKTELAQALAAKLECTHVIDDYVPELEQQMQMAMGHFAGYMGNLYIALGRYGRERAARDGICHTITCGTLIETAIYVAMHFAALDDVLSQEEKEAATPRVDATMRLLSCLFIDAFEYDQIFYLPADAASTDGEVAFVDKQLQAAVGVFKLAPVTVLAERETRLEGALRVIGG